MKALNLLRVVAHKDWGADCANLLKLYRSHVRLKLDYGCVVYGSARQSVPESLDCVQNVALNTCLGAFRTSPVASLHVEAGELPLELRRQQLCISVNFDQILATLLSIVYLGLASDSCLTSPNIIPTLGVRLNQTIVDSELNLNSIAINLTAYIPPWVLKPPGFQLSLHLLGNTSEISPTVYQSKFNELLSQCDGYARIFTDGSKSGEVVGSAAIVASRLSTGSQFLFLSDSFVPAKSPKLRPFTPSYCRNYMSCAWFNIRWFYVGSWSCWTGM